ncbi:UNVERIFIED_CONTAM: hypothetical protein Slati_3772900 [Sesamum latifolium]|uniref:Uncharacterized protein n=1 Tax=Sesamum latifolium TaxID=2727402 RepID=A0AAW2U593_9LAMI
MVGDPLVGFVPNSGIRAGLSGAGGNKWLEDLYTETSLPKNTVGVEAGVEAGVKAGVILELGMTETMMIKQKKEGAIIVE